MVEWDKVLTPEALGLEGKIDRVIWEQRANLEEEPILRAMVVLPRGVADNQLSWDLVEPLHKAVWDCIAEHLEAGHPHVLFISYEDQQAAERGDFYDEDDDVAA